MRFLKNILVIIVLLSISLTQTGCIVAAIGAVKYGNSKKKAAEAKTMEFYNQYVIGMEKINIERQSKNLKPVKIMTFKEYCNSADE